MSPVTKKWVARMLVCCVLLGSVGCGKRGPLETPPGGEPFPKTYPRP